MSFLGEEFTRTARWVLQSVIEMIFPPSEEVLMMRRTTRDEVARLVAPKTISLVIGTDKIRALQAISVTALLPYHDTLVQTLITEAKFENNYRAQELLGCILADYIKEYPSLVIIPLPLGKKRRKERGYNQVERIVFFALQELHARSEIFNMTLAPHLLVRTRETSPQTELGREARLQNMRDAFGVAHALDPSLTYVILDDVVTTGATLASAHEALRKARAKHITLLALAH